MLQTSIDYRLENLISTDATKTTPEEIEALLDELMPEHADD
tara:strand:+ start:511 stop:633 length:123 start_codon:yes stop_codon:yes gene_type:complete